MKKVIRQVEAEIAVNVKEIQGGYLYAYKTSDRVARLLRNLGGRYEWIPLYGNTRPYDTCFGSQYSLREAVEEVVDSGIGVTVYQFSTAKEFLRWAIQE